MTKIINLLKLTKPGVLAGNALTVPAGFFLAAAGVVNWWLFLAVLLGSTLIIAAACVLNNYLDQDIDRVMDRTKNRPLVQGLVKGWEALILCSLLLVVGLVILIFGTNWAVVIAGLIGFVDYVWLYGAWSKRQSVHGTLVGSISGAIPILAGYLAVRPVPDLGALLVFLLVFLWQQPEFYSISIYRKDEYKAANIPVISVVKGIAQTKLHILAYIAAFALVNLALAVWGYTGWIYAGLMVGFSLAWFIYGWQHRHSSDDYRWGKTMFRGAMYAILLVCLCLPFAPLLP